MRKRLLLGIAVLLLAGVGCTSHKHAATPAPTPAHHRTAAVPHDRDPRAVTAALARLDPCSLIDPRTAHSSLFPATTHPIANGPHTCALEHSSADLLVVGLGARSADRFDARPLLFAGSKAYQSPNNCRLDLPVSFTKAIVLNAAWGVTDRSARQCDETLRNFGLVAARALRHPAVTRRPLSDWTACAVLRDILGPSAGRLNDDDGIDRCHTPGSDLAQTTVRLAYGLEPRDHDTTHVAGRTVHVWSDCSLVWTQGPSGVAEQPFQLIEIHAPKCDRAKQLAAKTMQLLSGPAPKPSVTPQEPLTYRSNEPDVAAAGACVDFRDDLGLTCEPYHPVPVPDGTNAVLRAGQADPNVSCAVAVDAVRKYFGTALRPVVMSPDAASAGCAFVESDHAVVVKVWLQGSFNGGARTTVAGHAAAVGRPENPADPHTIAVSLSSADDDNLMVWVQYLHPRGDKYAGQGVPAGKPVALRDFAADIVTRYFS
jgi:hypothetical protein